MKLLEQRQNHTYLCAKDIMGIIAGHLLKQQYIDLLLDIWPMASLRALIHCFLPSFCILVFLCGGIFGSIPNV